MSRQSSRGFTINDQTGVIESRQEINRGGNRNVVDQRRNPAACDHLKIIDTKELGHQEGCDAHDRWHQLPTHG